MTLAEIKVELARLGYSVAFASRGIIAFDADANALPIRTDADGVLKVLIEGLYDGTTRTPVSVDINGKIDNSASITAHVDGLESLTQALIDLFKWERFDEIVEDGGYTYMGYRSRTDSTYRVMKVHDDTWNISYCYGDGTLPASATWADLTYS